MDTTSYINAEIYIREEDINRDIRIINSFENAKKEHKWWDKETDNIRRNEKEIKNCKIKIDGESIPFCYLYRFNKSGKHHIMYSFSINLTNINYMFFKCSSLTNIDLSNFNTQNVTDMSDMFNGCSSLVNLDLSNFNLKKVKYMTNIFNLCISLKNVKFNLLNVGDNINKINNFNFVHIEKD